MLGWLGRAPWPLFETVETIMPRGREFSAVGRQSCQPEALPKKNAFLG
jgi:hypothetical protein